MRSIALQTALTDFTEAAAGHLQAEITAGAEVPFELEQQAGRRGSSGPSLYCYRPLTSDFILAREASLQRMPSHEQAARLLAGFDGLDSYAAGAGGVARMGAVRAALCVLLCDVFAEQTDFQLRPERLRDALERLDQAAHVGGGDLTLVATLHGLTITSPELALAKGLTIAQPHALAGLPPALLATGEDHGEHLVVVLSAGDEEPARAVERGREVLTDLLRALRLFGDGRVTLGALAYSRVGEGSWSPVALGAGGRPYGMLVVTAEQEDELRAFCNLVSRRAPHRNEVAWALRRFELGCERESFQEALSDHLLALRALLEPEGPSSGLLAGRLAALCATPESRPALTARAIEALALERSIIAGTADEHSGARALTENIADHLRALLRDVICGHLDPDLVSLADEILLEDDEPEEEVDAVEPEQHAVADPFPAAAPAYSGEEIFGDPGESQEILDIFI
jgi:hypothetical protein